MSTIAISPIAVAQLAQNAEWLAKPAVLTESMLEARLGVTRSVSGVAVDAKLAEHRSRLDQRIERQDAAKEAMVTINQAKDEG